MNKLIRYQSIDQFPQERTETPRRARFGSTWTQTERLLIDEASKLDDDGYWSDVIIALDADTTEFRADGAGLLASAKLRSQAVVVYVDDASVSFPCDTFDHWRDNVRAVALTMERLRAIERYGVAKGGQQYTGWKALPATAMPAATDPIAILCDVLGWTPEAVRADLKRAIAKARISTHPDTGTLKHMWSDVQAAVTALAPT